MPASGKSTIAVRISESLGIPMLSKDSIKEVLFDDLGFHTISCYILIKILILIRKAAPEGAACFVIYKERNHKTSLI